MFPTGSRRVKVLKLLGIGLVVATALFIGVGFVLPNRWEVKRKVTIQAPTAIVHKRIATLRGWPEWAAWTEKTDPAATWEWGGVDGQLGSFMAWKGPKMGTGRLTLTESLPERVVFDGAIESDVVNARSTFTLTAVKDGSVDAVEVEWRDEGTTPPIVGGYMKSLIEDTLGKHFEAGLVGLKRVAEAEAPAVPVASRGTP